jgi:hypothetical protein
MDYEFVVVLYRPMSTLQNNEMYRNCNFLDSVNGCIQFSVNRK